MLAPVLEDPAVHKVGHDLKADLIVLGRHGIRLDGLSFDTMLAAYLLDANRSSQALEPLTLEQVGYKALDEDSVRGKGAKARPFAELPPDALVDYAGERTDLALQLAEAFEHKLVRARDHLMRIEPLEHTFFHPGRHDLGEEQRRFSAASDQLRYREHVLNQSAIQLLARDGQRLALHFHGKAGQRR